MISGILHFADYLKMLPSAWVFKNFIKGDDSSRKILSSSMIDAEVKNFTEPDSLRLQFRSLSIVDQLTCALIYLTGDGGFKVETFTGFNNVLVSSFLVYASTNQKNEIRLFGFHEFRQPLLHQFVSVISDASGGLADSNEPVSMWGCLCVNDVTLVASMAAQKLLKKRKNGSLNRTSSLQLKKVTGTSVLVKQETNDYLNTLIIAYCIKRQLIIETETEYFINTREFSRWLELPVNERLKDIVDSTLIFTGRIWLGLLNELLEHNVQLSTAVFPQEMQEQIQNIMTGLLFAGVAGVRKHGKDIVVCKVNLITENNENTSKSVLILPDYSVVIAQETDARELNNFMQTGIIASFDRVYKGMIDKQVLGDSLCRGTPGKFILEWLGKWNAPANVIETVREWLREFYRLYITERSILVSSDEKVTSQISSFSPLSDLIEQVPVHAVYMIKKGNEQKVKDILSGIGFDYRMPGQDYEYEIPALITSEQIASLPDKWVPFTETKIEEIDTSAMRGTKYGNELKTLDINEIMHVIDYSILTGQNLSIDYDGSPYIKDGLYTIKPLSCEKGIDPALEAEITRTHSRKRFYIKKIRKIGVISK